MSGTTTTGRRRATINFAKLSGAGNDFIILDHRTRATTRQLKELAQQICDRRRGVGADGLLIAERSRKADVRMRVFNPDGSEPGMCGNGARCFALYAYKVGWTGRTLRIETGAGTLEAQVLSATQVRVKMMLPQGFKQHTMVVDGRPYDVAAVTVGVPHAVVTVDDIDRVSLQALGGAIRRHRKFGRAGTNVDFIEPKQQFVYMRTYERGVEGETLACGTGACASAAILWKYHHRKSPIIVVTRSGAHLKIHLDGKDRHVRQIHLEGPARIIFTGSYQMRRGN